MSPEQAKELLPIIQAFSEGRAVQYRWPMNGPWTDADKLVLDGNAQWRIKPQPAEWWLCYPCSKVLLLGHVKGENCVVCGLPLRHVREVQGKP